MKRLLSSLAITLATNAAAQYVQVSTNVLAPTVGIGSFSVEAPLAPHISAELTGGVVLYSGENSLWKEDELSGYRLTAVGKCYLGRSGRANEGWFLGAYLRYVQLDGRDLPNQSPPSLIWGPRFGGRPFKTRRTVAGALFGYELVGVSGLTISIAAGLGPRLNLRYEVLDEARGRYLREEISGSTADRDGEGHVYGRFAIGYRLFSSRAKLERTVEEEVQREQWLRLLERVTDEAGELDFEEAARLGLRPGDARRLQQRTRREERRERRRERRL